MGSDRKSKEDRKKRKSDRSPSISSSTEDEGKSRKRHRREEEEVRRSRSRKSDDKGRRKDKSHKHRSNKEKKKDKHRGKQHKSDHHSKFKVQELSSDDYFSKNNEFATWLKEEKKLFFSDLSSESARELFSDFVKDWNSEKLESRYYEGITTGPRSAHKWVIKR